MDRLQWLTRLWICYLCLAAPVLSQSSNDPLSNAPLSRLVTIQRGGSPLRQVLQDLSQQAGVSLRMGSDIASWRACVFVRQVPASEVMRAIAQTFGLAWRYSSNAYELYLPAESKIQQENQIRQVVTQQRRQLLETLRGLNEPGGDDSTMQSMLRSNPQFAAVLQALQEEEWQQVLRGRAVLVRAERLNLPRRVANLTAIEVVYNPLRQQWRFSQYAPQTFSSSVWGVNRHEDAPRLKIAELFSPNEAAQRVVDRPRNPQRITVTEALLALANASGVGVVAEFYPLTMAPNISSPMPSQVSGIIDWLNLLGFYQARREGNLLLLSARAQMWHRLSDIPRETLERWLGEANRFGLSLPTVLEIWRLSDLQRTALAEWASWMSMYYHYDTPVRAQFYAAVADVAQQHHPLLRAVALLPSPLSQQLLSGRPVTLSARNVATQKAYLYATAQLPSAAVQEVQLQANTERKTEYGAVVISPIAQGGMLTNVITREVDRLEALQDYLSRQQVMGTPYWFRAEVDYVTLRLTVGGRELSQRRLELRRYTPLASTPRRTYCPLDQSRGSC